MAAGCVVFAAISVAQSKPERLQCESLTEPLGMDAEHPVLSWQLRDPRDAARQTAYRIEVASSQQNLNTGKADIWDSGKVGFDNSRGIAYAGPALQQSRRYFWRVLVWDRDGKPYPASDSTWWETGLMKQANWNAKWIGYEEPELRAMRETGAEWITNPEVEDFKETTNTRQDFRMRFQLSIQVGQALL
jgi:alpha-L-rhamnosidase